MNTLVVLLAIFGCSYAQYINRGAHGLVGHAGYGQAGISNLGYGGQFIQPGFQGYRQEIAVPQIQYSAIRQSPRLSAQYSAPVQYSAPIQQYSSAPIQQYSQVQYPRPIQYSAPAVQYQSPIQYSSPAKPAVRTAAILRQSQDVSHDGTYNYGFESENGIAVQSAGSVKALGPEDSAHVAQGSYSYVAPDGTPITTNWYADETGFHAEGAHIPQGPVGHTRTA